MRIKLSDTIHKFTARKDKTDARTAICSAISSRQIIGFYYHGGTHLVEPFCLGVAMNGDADNESLLCYQVGGYSEFGEAVGWKLFRYSEISNLEATGDHFTDIRPDYDPDNPGMTTIHCSISMNTVGGSEPEKSEKPAQSGTAESLSDDKRQACAVSPLTHNEYMERFRHSHSL